MHKKIKISIKLWCLTGLMLLVVLIVALTSIFSLNRILSGNQKFVTASEHDLFIAQKEIDHLKWVNRVKDLFVNKLDKTDVQLDYTKCGLGKFLYGEKSMVMAATDTKMADLLEAIKKPHIDLHQSAVFINTTVKEAGHDKALEVFQASTLPALAQTQAAMAAIAGKLSETMKSSKAEMISTGMSAKWAAIIVTMFGFLSGGILSAFVIRSITKPVQRIISGLNEGADQVASASSQISSSSQSLAEGASEQAASIEETSSSLEEMSSMTKQNADNAGQADKLMQEANRVVEKAGSSMTQLKTSMVDISQASDDTSKIIKTIDEIAFQTNLLALNAAVEAARAGEAGAGFAVVADEVRNLAMRAADAAKTTAEMIESTVKKVGEGSGLVDTTSTAFTEVAESAARVGELVSEIAAASNEQSQGIEQVNTAASEMGQVTQNNAATAEESASASEQMNAQAAQMKAMVAELLELVNGSGNGVVRSTVSAAGVSGLRRKNANFKPSFDTSARKEKGHKPEASIPLDDDVFKDF